MKKPFATAYDAIKKLLQSIFGGKKKDGAEEAEITPEEKPEQEEPEKVEPEKTEAKKAEEPVKQEKPVKPDKKKSEKASSKKEDEGKKLEQVLANIAEEEGIKEEKKSKSEIDEQKKYEQEVKKRAERAARREREDKKKEEAEAAAEKAGEVKTVIDPVTGEEISMGTLPAEAKYLKKYMRVPTTSDDIVVAVNSIIKHPDMPKNIVILGRNGFGTVKVGEDFARSFYELGLVKSDKIAKAKAKQLNKMSLDTLTKLKGGCLIIENAGLVSFGKLVEVIKDSAPENNDYVVILTGEIDSIANFFEENEDIVDSFIYLIDIHKIKERGMMHLARGYVKEREYKADKSVFDRIKGSLKSMEEGNIDRFLKHIDDIIDKCDKREAASGKDPEKVIILEDANV